jgi:hypothetical protein
MSDGIETAVPNVANPHQIPNAATTGRDFLRRTESLRALIDQHGAMPALKEA